MFQQGLNQIAVAIAASSLLVVSAKIVIDALAKRFG